MSRRGAAPLHIVSALTALGVAVLLFGGCSRSAEEVAAKGAILVRGGGPEPDSLDPQKARGFEAQSILRDLCEGLTTLDKKGRVAPGVARSWHASLDGLRYTFDLRNDARWSNGDRVVGADFVAALQRLVDPATGSAYAQYIDPEPRPSTPSVSPHPMTRRWSSRSRRLRLICRHCSRIRPPVRCTARRCNGSRKPLRAQAP
jgi:ABC-type transport system substrate-binding protein